MKTWTKNDVIEALKDKNKVVVCDDTLVSRETLNKYHTKNDYVLLSGDDGGIILWKNFDFKNIKIYQLIGPREPFDPSIKIACG